jgi:ATP-grasp ribosomal peptide maturase
MTFSLIVSADGDWSAEQVAGQLAERGHRHAWIDPGDFPLRLTLDASLNGSSWTGAVSRSGEPIRLEAVTAVFYRRPNDFTFAKGMSEPEQRFARTQARVGLGGVLASLPVRWVNHPSALADAEYKPRQLAVASAVGLQVPRTLVTNDAAAVRRFAASVRDLVVKPLGDVLMSEAGDLTAVWTRRLPDDELADLAGVEHTAHLFQQWVPKAYEVRLIMAGCRAFAVAIHAGSDRAHVDWRSDYDALSYEVIACPDPIREKAAAFLDRFGLRYGAFDFAVTATGQWWFLECNGAGQWGWLAEECGLPIAAALAEDLIEERR